jgi:hypothetical protein
MKAVYRHQKTGDIFAIETDDEGRVLSTCGPLFDKDFDPKMLDYDQYWNTEIQARLADFVRICPDDYLRLLHENGFHSQVTQNYLF